MSASKVKICILTALLLAVMPVFTFAQNSEWFCPVCGKSGNSGKFCPSCGHAKPADNVLFYDDMQSEEPGGKWYVHELKDCEESGAGIDGTIKITYSGQPVPIYTTRQGYRVIASTQEKCTNTITRISWDAFHEHSHEVTDVYEIPTFGSLQPAIDGHPVFVPERFTFEFDIYLFAPDSGTRRNDDEDFCAILFCGHSFYINTWGRDIYNMYFVGSDGLKGLPVTKSGWHHFKFRFIGPDNDKVVMFVDGQMQGTKTGVPYPNLVGKDDYHISFSSGSNSKYFCIKNVKIIDESGD